MDATEGLGDPSEGRQVHCRPQQERQGVYRSFFRA